MKHRQHPSEVLSGEGEENDFGIADSGSVDQPTPDMSITASHESLKELIEKNIKWSQVVYHQNKSIKRRLGLMVLGDYIRLLLVLVPIIFGLIYLPPLVTQAREAFESAMEGGGQGFDIPKLLQQFLGEEQGDRKNAAQDRK